MIAAATPPILSIGAAVDADPDSRAWQREIAAAGKQVVAARGVLLELLRAAVDEAEAFARSRGLADELREIRAIVDRLPAA